MKASKDLWTISELRRAVGNLSLRHDQHIHTVAMVAGELWLWVGADDVRDSECIRINQEGDVLSE